MKPKKRQKLCQNCEGEVDLDVIVCPYCAADLREEKPEQAHQTYTHGPFGPRETMHSLYPPPYPIREEELPKEAALPPPAEEEKEKNIITPTILFTLGVQLLLLGLFMLLFSREGVIVLKWEARHWYLYALASFPLLYFGYKSLSKI